MMTPGRGSRTGNDAGPGDPPPVRVLVTGGGTGGHVYPGLAVGEALRKLVPEVDVRFAGTGRSLESVLVPRAGFPFIRVPASAWRGLSIAQRATDPFGRLVATGVTSGIILYGVTNIAMVTGLVPVIGVPLPFVSYGGTAMLSSLAALGILLNIDRTGKSYQELRRRWQRAGMGQT